MGGPPKFAYGGQGSARPKLCYKGGKAKLGYGGYWIEIILMYI